MPKDEYRILLTATFATKNMRDSARAALKTFIQGADFKDAFTVEASHITSDSCSVAETGEGTLEKLI